MRWHDLLSQLQSCAGETAFVSDGKSTEPAAAVRTRPAARGAELCLVSGEAPIARDDLIASLERLSKAPGRRFMSAARGTVGTASLPIDGVADETIDGTLVTVIALRRPSASFNHRLQTGESTTLRTKRIKNGN